MKVKKGRSYEVLVQSLVEKLTNTIPGLASSTVLGGATKSSKHPDPSVGMVEQANLTDKCDATFHQR